MLCSLPDWLTESRTQTYTLPAAWASALVNNDFSSTDLTASDLAAIRAFQREILPLRIVDCARDPSGTIPDPSPTPQWHDAIHLISERRTLKYIAL